MKEHKTIQAHSNPFRPPWWLKAAHAQTVYSSLYVPRPKVEYRRERWETPDGDFVDIDFVDGAPDKPWVHMFHGLEGSSASGYAISLMHAVKQLGWNGSVLNWRGCSGEPNRTVRAYHSGDSSEVNWVLRQIKNRIQQNGHSAPLFASGVSLGGNALLKWLGEQKSVASDVVQGAIGICAPMDLAAGGAALEKGFTRTYGAHFLGTLRDKAIIKLAREGETDSARITALRQSKTLREFDNWYTAPVHGYIDTPDYWARASSKPGLKDITVPTLIICAKDDPIVPAHSLPTADEVSNNVMLEYTEHGGHCGFVSGPFPGNISWLSQRILNYVHTLII